VHEERRELQKALDAYRRSLSIHPEQPEANRRAGLLLKELKAYREAEEMLERAAELDPRDPNVLHQLAAVRALLLVHGGIPESAVTP
jgi:tetratricopeptide (TPR) repeat protein